VTAAALLGLATFALLLALLQAVALRRCLGERTPEPRFCPFMSILKPLCGIDDALWNNLRSFIGLRYPDYEILLGVRDASDPAYPLALRAAAHWPGRVRVVLQRSSPGFNPKVNQLITLAAAARGEILVVNDSNVRVRRDYLRGIAAAFDDPRVALATHPVAGIGERSAGALFDNMTMCGSVAPGIVSTKRIAGKDLVVGKSMALRRRDLEAMGGFERLKDVLAEDFLSGRIVTQELGKLVALVPQPVFNVSRSQSVKAFWSRYLRWSVMQRKAVGDVAYATQILLNPVALGLAALVAMPDWRSLLAFALISLSRVALHEWCARMLRGRGFSGGCLGAVLSDLLVASAWAAAFTRNEINWRGNRLKVCAGTQLEPVPTPPLPDLDQFPAWR
jgi:ceramide glucosyltransferase